MGEWLWNWIKGFIGNGIFNRKQNIICNGWKNYCFSGAAAKHPISNEEIQIRTSVKTCFPKSFFIRWRILRHRYV